MRRLQQDRPGRSKRVPAHRIALYWVGLLLLLVTFIELSSRVFLTAKFGASLLDPATSIHRFYPRLENLADIQRKSRDDSFDVLLLGASVIEQVVGPLTKRISAATVMPVNVVTFAVSAHTSRDSRFKYRHLASANFDLVVFYHAINDVRANNIARSAYRADYSHFAWYATINVIEDRERKIPGAAPLAFDLALREVRVRLGMIETIPMTRVRQGQFEHGRLIKTANAFRENLVEILTLADEVGTPVAVLTFANYLPPNYSFERFLAGELDYQPSKVFGLPVELWGAPRNVEASIEAHNRVITNVTSKFEGAILVDQERLIPDDGKYFVDICHLSSEGVTLFVDNLMTVIAPLLTSAELRVSPTPN